MLLNNHKIFVKYQILYILLIFLHSCKTVSSPGHRVDPRRSFRSRIVVGSESVRQLAVRSGVDGQTRKPDRRLSELPNGPTR